MVRAMAVTRMAFRAFTKTVVFMTEAPRRAIFMVKVNTAQARAAAVAKRMPIVWLSRPIGFRVPRVEKDWKTRPGTGPGKPERMGQENYLSELMQSTARQ